MAFWNRKENKPGGKAGGAKTAIQWAVELITEYEQVLRAEFGDDPQPIAVDYNLLPADKERIKGAYKILFVMVEDPEGLAMMRQYFLALAHFQPGVGLHPVMPIEDQAAHKRRFMRTAFSSPEEAARELTRSGTFPAAVEEERVQLMEELRSFGQ